MHKRFFKYWLPVIIWMSVIFWMSTGMFSYEQTSRVIVPILHFLFPWLSPYHVNVLHGLIRKSAHITEYFILGFLLFCAFRSGASQKWCLRWTIYTIVGVVLYAASDEFHQSFVASRTASIIDVGIDSAGGLLFQIAIVLGVKIWGHSN
ncbi:MAG: VanZ family protein [Syntrophales bacterium]